MARLPDALIEGAYARNNGAPILDLQYGGQGGWAPNLSEWVSNQAFVTRPLIPICLEVPRIFRFFPNSEKWVASFKAMMELHPRSIEGLNATLEVQFDDHPVGGGGEIHQEIVDTKRTRSAPVHAYVEKYGRPIQLLHEYWIRYGGMDPEAKYALAVVLSGGQVTDMLADMFTATMLYIRPDAIHKNVDAAWICANMFPNGAGDITAKRDLTTGQELLNLSIEYTSIAQYGAGVNQFAQQILDSISITHADPFFRPAFVDGISADVEAADKGYKNWVEEIGRTSVSNMDS